MITSRLQLETIACDFCAEVIERAVKRLPGITECKVNVGMKQVVVEYDVQHTNLPAIQHALTSAGYTARPVEEQSIQLDETSKLTTNL
jgi:copper chaperone CopZ